MTDSGAKLPSLRMLLGGEDVRDFEDVGDVGYDYYVVLEVCTHVPQLPHKPVAVWHLIHGLNECAEYPGSILIPVRQQTGTRTGVASLKYPLWLTST